MLGIKGQVQKILGEGTHWLIKEIKLELPIIIHKIIYDSVVCKFPKRSISDITKNLSIYKVIRNANLPTLSFLEHGLFKNEECLVAENICNKDDFFVSANTLRNIPDLTYLILHPEARNFIKPLNETFLAQNKIENIANLESFCCDLKKLAYRVGENGIGLCPNALFLGVNKQSYNLLTSCIIADFDCILTNIDNQNETDINKLLNCNMHNIGTTLCEFLSFFVKNERKQEYTNYVNKFFNLATTSRLHHGSTTLKTERL